MQPQHIVLPGQQAQPTRIFYVLDLTSTHEFVWEIDGYKVPDGKTGNDLWMLNIVCPTCLNNLTIDSTKKAMEVSEESLSVELFRCSHPAQFGGQCPFTAAIEPPRGNQKTAVTHDGIRRRMDGVFVRG